MSEEKYDTLVLPGGGVKGFTLLGALQALVDKNLLTDIKNYVGTSVGSIICYLLAIGYTPVELMVSVYTNRWMERLQCFNLIAVINGNGATSFTPLHEALEKLSLNKIGKLPTLSKLREDYGKTLICTTYNATTCQTEYLGPDNYPDLPCITALRMSANIPLVFDRFKYMNNFYIDGGISDNFAINIGEEIGNSILGIFMDVSEKSLKDEPEDGMMSYFFRLLQVPIIQSTKYKVKLVQDKYNYVGETGINTKKLSIYKIECEDLRNIIQFDIESKTRLDMFSSGYSQIIDKLKEVQSDESSTDLLFTSNLSHKSGSERTNSVHIEKIEEIVNNNII